MNKVFLIGRTTKDIEIRTSSNGTRYCYFTLAVERDYKDQQTNQRVTDFIDLIAWRNNADYLEKYVNKGRLILVEGTITVRQGQTTNGYSNNQIQILCEKIEFVGPSNTQTKKMSQQQDSFEPVKPTSNYRPNIQKPTYDNDDYLSFGTDPIVLNSEDTDLPF